MKSQELIHIHRLLFEVRQFVEQREDAPADAFAAYDAQQIRPTHFHRGKSAHEEAVGLLLDGFGKRVHEPPQA